MSDPNVTIEVQGIEELRARMDQILERIKLNGNQVIDEVSQKVAEDIRQKFDGGTVGFEDRTGALRRSIRGGLVEAFGGPSSEPVGVVGAGDDSVGSNGRSTADYVTYVEYGELYGHKQTAFLRPGVNQAAGLILAEVANALDPEILAGRFDFKPNSKSVANESF